MWPVVVGCVIGAVLMGRTKPRTPVRKRELIGPNTGNAYLVDDFTQAGVIIVHGPGCACVFARGPGGRGFRFVTGKGDQNGMREVCLDLEPALLQQPQKKDE